MVSKGQRLEAGSTRTSPSKVNRLKMPRPKGRAAQQCCKKWKYKFKTGTILKGQIINSKFRFFIIMCLEPVNKMTGILWWSLSKKRDKDAKNSKYWVMFTRFLIYCFTLNTKVQSETGDKQSNWHWEWLVAALETLFIDTLTHTHTLKHAHGY